MIPYGRQDINDEDIQAVVEVLRSDWLTQGPVIERFEAEVARYCGTKYAVAVSNATAALHIACIAAGLHQEDVFWTSPNTFVASANCGLYCGARPDFVDIDPKTYNIDPDALEQKLAEAERLGSLPKVVIPVHFAGQSADMARIASLAQRYRFTIIEDASHGIGGYYKNKPIGSSAFSDMTVFSFHPVKIITSGEGGMVLTNRTDLYEKLLRLRSHGITRDQSQMTGESDGAWYYQQIELGFNYRMTDMQAALGLSQMKRLDEFVNRRNYLAQRYDTELAHLAVLRPWRHSDTHSAFHLYVIQIDPERTSRNRRQVFDELRASGIYVNVHYIPVHLQPYYRRLGFRPGDFPNAEQYYSLAISLPMYPGLSDGDQDLVIRKLEEILH